MKNKPTSGLDDLKFDLKGGSYEELANSLEYWAEGFYLETLHDAYGDCLAYLLYNISKEMRQVSIAEEENATSI
jgi:hypothetical protein